MKSILVWLKCKITNVVKLHMENYFPCYYVVFVVFQKCMTCINYSKRVSVSVSVHAWQTDDREYYYLTDL